MVFSHFFSLDQFLTVTDCNFGTNFGTHDVTVIIRLLSLLPAE